MAEKQTLTPRTSEIYDSVVYIYDSANGNDESLILAADNFEVMRSDVIQQADLATKAARGYVTKKFETNYFYSLLMRKDPPGPASVKVRDVIVNARSRADSLLYLAVQLMLRRNAELPDNEKMQVPAERKPDFCDDNLKDWLECLEKLPCLTSSANPGKELCDLLGFLDTNTRHQWVLTLRKLSDRFIHRGVFFLETDFKEMQTVLPSSDVEEKAFAVESTSKQMDENEIFCRFVVYVNTQIEKLAKLSSH